MDRQRGSCARAPWMSITRTAEASAHPAVLSLTSQYVGLSCTCVPLAGPTQADPASAQAAAQRCKELMDSWRALKAQQQRSASLDDQELLQHQMSQMRQSIDKMRMTSFEYGH